jgi:opacity protein-like surface antigen
MALPYTSLHFTDIHHLRATGVDAFRQDPSFVGTFSNPFWNGGWGYQVEAGVAYRVWQTLRVELGYQWWFVRAGAGTLIQRQLVAGDVPAPLNFAKTSRHGVLFGISYTF